MAHVLIPGQTLSGKSTLGKELARGYRRNNIGVLVLDPLLDPGWQADFITDDPQEFLRVFWESRSCAAFMDEAGESVGRYELAMQQTATRGRHFGHRCHYLMQRSVQIAPIVRDQCTTIYLFCSGKKDCSIHAEEFNEPMLERAYMQSAGSYTRKQRFKPAILGNVFTGVHVYESDSDVDRRGNVRGRPLAPERGGGQERSSAQAGEREDEGGGEGAGQGAGES